LLKFIDSVFVFSHIRILLHCGGVQIPKPKKTETEYLRLKTEPNRTEFEKSKPTQPYRESKVMENKVMEIKSKTA